MSEEVIYEKRYPHIDPMEELSQVEIDGADESEQPNPTFDEIMQKIYGDTTYVLMPERTKASEEFVRAAIEVAELYELDTKITRHVGLLRKFCVSEFRQNQEFHVINVHNDGLFPLTTTLPIERDGMRAARGVNAVALYRES